MTSSKDCKDVVSPSYQDIDRFYLEDDSDKSASSAWKSVPNQNVSNLLEQDEYATGPNKSHQSMSTTQREMEISSSVMLIPWLDYRSESNPLYPSNDTITNSTCDNVDRSTHQDAAAEVYRDLSTAEPQLDDLDEIMSGSIYDAQTANKMFEENMLDLDQAEYDLQSADIQTSTFKKENQESQFSPNESKLYDSSSQSSCDENLRHTSPQLLSMNYSLETTIPSLTRNEFIDLDIKIYPSIDDNTQITDLVTSETHENDYLLDAEICTKRNEDTFKDSVLSLYTKVIDSNVQENVEYRHDTIDHVTGSIVVANETSLENTRETMQSENPFVQATEPSRKKCRTKWSTYIDRDKVQSHMKYANTGISKQSTRVSLLLTAEQQLMKGLRALYPELPSRVSLQTQKHLNI
jgi:hypothetical protein